MNFQPKHSKESGQTLVLVAVSIVTLFAVAALAVDLTALYSVRGEMQRAADAAAIAGAKAFVESGTTTAPNDANLQLLARNVAALYIDAVLQVNTVGGAVPSKTSTFDFSNGRNPTISVTVQRDDVPTFFAHIFGRRAATVKATAIAEAYNSSLPPGGGTLMPPVGPSCVKPWMVINLDPNDHGSGPNRPFVNADGSLGGPNAGAYTGPGTGIVGEPLVLSNRWLATLPAPLNAVGYLPAKLNAVSGSCPSCAIGGDLAQSVACCDTANTYSCGTVKNMYVDLLNNGIADTLDGAACLLTGGSGGGGATSGLDTLDLGNFQTSRGTDPIEITAGTGPQIGRRVNTSPQIVTLPIMDTNLVDAVTGQVKVMGFMQAFVHGTIAGGGIQMTVLNISGCGGNVDPNKTPVTGGGVSPVPVRLIKQ